MPGLFKKLYRDRELEQAQLARPAGQERDFTENCGQSSLLQALSRLPGVQREALTLYYFDELKIREIARITGTNTATVKSRLHQGKQKLKKYWRRKANEKGPGINKTVPAGASCGCAGQKRVLEAVEKAYGSKGRYSYQPGSRFLYAAYPFSRGYWCFQAFWLLLGASAVLWLGDLTAYGLNSPFFTPSVPGGLVEQGSVSYVVLLPVLSAIMALAGAAGFAELGKCFSCHMWELEHSCCLDLRQLLAVRMAITGLVDLLLLVCFTAVSRGRLQTGFWQTGIYLLTPFVYNTLLYLTVFTFTRGNNRFLQACVLAAACCISFLPACIPHLYEKTMLWLWVAALAAAGSLVVAELYCLAGKLERGEELCWN